MRETLRRSRWIAAALLGLAAVWQGTAQDSTRPANLTIHTWVREDVFAGLLFDDLERFEVGVKKLDDALKTNPDDAHALAWRGDAELYLAVRAHEAGKSAEFTRLYERATGMHERAYSLAPKDQGVLATSGGGYAALADRLPAAQKAEAWKRALSRYEALAVEQAQFAAKLPLHMRGELLAGLAQSAQRSGEAEKTKKYLQDLVEALPGSPYEPIAKRWLAEPEAAAKGKLVCQTCHEAGRLKNRLAAMGK
jgi:tetratricopeptide (TPR) repeat protein